MRSDYEATTLPRRKGGRSRTVTRPRFRTCQYRSCPCGSERTAKPLPPSEKKLLSCVRVPLIDSVAAHGTFYRLSSPSVIRAITRYSSAWPRSSADGRDGEKRVVGRSKLASTPPSALPLVYYVIAAMDVLAHLQRRCIRQTYQTPALVPLPSGPGSRWDV